MLSFHRYYPTLTSITSTRLLDALKDTGNQAAWRAYVERYRPLLLAFAGRLGLGAADSEDVTQQTLIVFCTAYDQGKYDRQKGRLRAWLFTIARNQVATWRRSRPRREVHVDSPADQTDFFAQATVDAGLEQVWEEQWRQSVLRQCLEQVQREVEEQTFRAFDLFTLQGWPAQQVADVLGITGNAVFGAKRRVLQRVREIMPLIESECA